MTKTLSSSLVRVTGFMCGFIGNVLLARAVTPRELGTFYFALSFASILMCIQTGYVTGAINRISGGVKDRREIIGSVFLSLFVVLVILVPISVILSALTKAKFIHVYTLSGSLSLFAGFSSLYIGFDKIHLNELFDAIRTVLTIVGQLVLIYSVSDTVGLVYGYAIPTATLGLVIIYSLPNPKFPSKDVITNMIEFVKYSIPRKIIGVIYRRTEVIMIGTLLTSALVGEFQIAFKLSIVVAIVPTVLSKQILTDTSSDKSDSNLIRFVGLVGIPFCVGAYFVGGDIIQLFYGIEYQRAGEFLYLLAIYRLVSSYSEASISMLDGLDKPYSNLRLLGISLPINLLISWILYTQHGIIGLITGSIITEVLLLVRLQKQITDTCGKVPIYNTEILYQLISAGVMAICVYTIIRTSIHTLIVVVLGAIIYFCTLAIIYRLREHPINNYIEK